MLQNIKRNITRQIINIPGWRTNRKIVVFESDDWGSIRMPSKDVYQKLLKSGIIVDKGQYCKYDSLATENDLSLLFDVLTSVKDKNGNAGIITANTLVANPDFEKIKESDFTSYYYKIITNRFQEFKGCENALE